MIFENKSHVCVYTRIVFLMVTSTNFLCNTLDVAYSITIVVSAVKAKNVVTLAVDGVGTYPGIGEAGVSATDTKDPLYVGGMPEEGE